MPSVKESETMRAWGSRYARLVLERAGNNKRQACRVLGISYHTLQAYLRYRAHPARPRGAAPLRPLRPAPPAADEDAPPVRPGPPAWSPASRQASGLTLRAEGPGGPGG